MGGAGMSNVLLTPEQRAFQEQVRTFVREQVPRELLLDMDAERVQYPHAYIQNLAGQGLLGVRFSREWGGRGLDWSYEVLALEEIGVLGASLACLFSLPSIVGEAIHTFGTQAQKEKYLKPILLLWRHDTGQPEGRSFPVERSEALHCRR
jgi:acyl-CoA dehydrogenase